MSRPALASLPDDDEILIRRADLPGYIPIAAQTLARWAVEGKGPRFVKLSGRVAAYRAGDVRDWLRKHKSRQNTAETP